MPTNITQGNSAQFIAEFYDSSGVLTVPSSATLTMTYTTVSGTTASSATGMTQVGSYFEATWGSSVAAFGNANWSISAPGQATPTTGTLRLLDP
jgi:hypothetical protein